MLQTFSATYLGCRGSNEDEKMGIIICPDHGRQYITPCCVHIAGAVDAGVLEKAHVVVDDWVSPSIVCTPCERLVSAAERSTEEPNVGVDHVLESPSLPYCEVCLRDWFLATGQGDLRELIAQVRAPHLK
jgi:hypothetical protein